MAKRYTIKKGKKTKKARATRKPDHTGGKVSKRKGKAKKRVNADDVETDGEANKSVNADGVGVEVGRYEPIPSWALPDPPIEEGADIPYYKSHCSPPYRILNVSLVLNKVQTAEDLIRFLPIRDAAIQELLKQYRRSRRFFDSKTLKKILNYNDLQRRLQSAGYQNDASSVESLLKEVVLTLLEGQERTNETTSYNTMIIPTSEELQCVDAFMTMSTTGKFQAKTLHKLRQALRNRRDSLLWSLIDSTIVGLMCELGVFEGDEESIV